ncbi:hypothetical protein [Leekyejoonella antrihumi]|uniref:Uncharacterized protein n=1 Tax=Leekyejoonella antrihumi TaxID=1660198 RepID=A0A563E8M7_9MICO|nr:hypothetical protein FGL98_01850 [Leekyejoonella antrihumi]
MLQALQRGDAGADGLVPVEIADVTLQVQPGRAVERRDLAPVGGPVDERAVVDADIPRCVAARGRLDEGASADHDAQPAGQRGGLLQLLLFVVVSRRRLEERRLGDRVGRGRRRSRSLRRRAIPSSGR